MVRLKKNVGLRQHAHLGGVEHRRRVSPPAQIPRRFLDDVIKILPHRHVPEFDVVRLLPQEVV